MIYLPTAVQLLCHGTFLFLLSFPSSLCSTFSWLSWPELSSVAVSFNFSLPCVILYLFCVMLFLSFALPPLSSASLCILSLN